MQAIYTFLCHPIRTSTVLAVACLPLLSLSAFAETAYTITELHPAAGDVESLGMALNAAGVVVGTSHNEFNQPQAILWQPDGTPTPLISTGRPFSKAHDINDANVVVGVYADSSANVLACRWNADLSQDNLSVLLPASPSEALTINNAGDIAGFYIGTSRFPQAFLLEGGVLASPLTFNQAFSSRAFALNQHGDLAGTCLGNTAGHGFLKSKQSQNTLPNLPDGSFGEINAVNNLGQAAGFSDQIDGQETACIWTNGAITALGHLGGGQSRALGMNNFGQVVGSSLTAPSIPHVTTFDPNGNPLPQQFTEVNNLNNFTNKVYDYETSRAFLWDGTTMQNLNDLIPSNSGWVLISAEDINDAGWIVGYGSYNGALRGFLLQPTTPVTQQVVLSIPEQQTTLIQTDEIPIQVNTAAPPHLIKLYINGTFQQHITSGSVILNPNSLAFGSHLIRIETVDTENTVTSSQEVAINLRDLFFSEWKARHLGSASALDTSDTDQDGLNNLLEFAFNLAPDENSPTLPLQINFEGNKPQFQFKRRKAFADQGLTYTIKISENLKDWYDAATFLEMNSPQSDGDTNPMETVKYEYTGPAPDQLFYQIEVTQSSTP